MAVRVWDLLFTPLVSHGNPCKQVFPVKLENLPEFNKGQHYRLGLSD